MTAAVAVPGDVAVREAELRESAAAEAERAAFAAWERAYSDFEAAAAEHVRALMRGGQR